MNRLPWIAALLGALLGPLDYLLFALFDVDMTVAGRDVTFIVMAFYSANYAAIGWLIGRVILQKRQIRAQLTALAASQAEAAQNEKLATIGRLAAGVAHEVRNPLAVIKSSAALLAESVPPDDAGLATAAGFIQAEITRLDGFITSLLDFSKPRNPQLDQVLASTVLMRLGPLATSDGAARGVVVDLIDESGGAVAALDTDQLTQALFALVVNAGQAAGAGGRVRVRALPGPVFEVADNGPGVAAADTPRIFEPFFTTKARGTGLGLAMAARITEAHGGTLRLVPGSGLGPEGRGACFHLSLQRVTA